MRMVGHESRRAACRQPAGLVSLAIPETGRRQHSPVPDRKPWIEHCQSGGSESARSASNMEAGRSRGNPMVFIFAEIKVSKFSSVVASLASDLRLTQM